MHEDYRRHDISDDLWIVIEPNTIGNKGSQGGNAKDTRQFINGLFWILRTGAPWRDMPPCYGHWNAVQRRFCRWRDKGTWENILFSIVGELECEWLIVDGSFVKAHKAILLLVVGGFAKTLRVLRLRAANPPTMNWKIAILLKTSSKFSSDGG